MTDQDDKPQGERVAKLIAKAGLCSRRDAEKLIEERRVTLDGETIDTPATFVDNPTRIAVDGRTLPPAQETRLWRYSKPQGLVTSHKDEEDRPTVFQRLPRELPRVVSVGRLDMNSEGLLLLTNDGKLAGQLENPKTGWVRTYRVRVFGHVTQEMLDELAEGVTIEGIHYAPIKATLEKVQSRNAWINVELTEGKNREIRRVMEYLGVQVNRLIRVSYGPFKLGDLTRGEVREVTHSQLVDFCGTFLGIDMEKRAKREGWAKPKAKPKFKGKARAKPKRDDGPPTGAKSPRKGKPGAAKPPRKRAPKKG